MEKPVPTINRVHGRITFADSAYGVPGLLVQVSAIASPVRPTPNVSRGRSTRQSRQTASTASTSIGTVLTNKLGDFELLYHDTAFTFTSNGEGRPNLQLTVRVPERKGIASELRLLYTSDLRATAGRQEYFAIILPPESLETHGIRPPITRDSLTNAKSLGKQIRKKWELAQDRRDELKAVAKERAAVKSTRLKNIEASIRDRVIRDVTGIQPNSESEKRFVPPGSQAMKVARTYQNEKIKSAITDAPGRVTYLALTDTEFDDLLDPQGNAIPALVQARLRANSDAPSRLRDDPLHRVCVQEANPPTDAIATETSDSSESSTVDDQPPAAFDLARGLADVMNQIHSPESVGANLGQRPNSDMVAGDVKTFSLEKGPADTPAIYDFHSLQMAFEHVWEDARLDGILQRAVKQFSFLDDNGADMDSVVASAEPILTTMARTAAPFIEPDSEIYDTVQIGEGVPPGGDTDDPDTHYPPDNPHGDPGPTPPTNDSELYPTVAAEPSAGYPFAVFAAGTVNYGLLVTYRQRWTPVAYQVGRLAKTLTLGPKESLSFTSRQVIKTSIGRKQAINSQQMRKEDAESTQRDEAEIVARAESKTNFSVTASGSFEIGPISEGSASTTFGRDAASNSQETKKAFREAVRKSAQEFRDERKTEVETANSDELEVTEKREISNSNDELTVTYLFYELQRRYQVWEQLHRITPIALVAQPMPKPEQIDEIWILQHDWIIRRFLPDDSFLPALTALSERIAGDRVILTSLESNVTTLRQTLAATKSELVKLRNQTDSRYAALEAAVSIRAGAIQSEASEGFWNKLGDTLGDGDDDLSVEKARVLEDAARDAYERVERIAKDTSTRLEREVTALQVATETYTKALAEEGNQQQQINRLIQHVKDNILHYMHGIWSYEQPDQRLFRHFALEVPRLIALEKKYTVRPIDGWPLGVTPAPGKKCYEVTLEIAAAPTPNGSDPEATDSLAELVDLDKPLGFKGNYIIYPLKRSNALTDYMITPYLDAEAELRDPDGFGNWTLERFDQYDACLKRKLADRYAEVADELTQQRLQILMDPHRNGEEIVVPTDSLYIEALAGKHPLIEDFKLKHRAIDVMKVQAEVRGVELENLRKAARLAAGEREDPNIDKKIVVDRAISNVIVPPNDQ